MIDLIPRRNLMKRLMLGVVSVLLASAAIAPIASAEPVAANRTSAGITSPFTYQTSPYDLVYLAHRGYFAAQGIPSYSSFLSAYRFGRLSALDIVKSAVEVGKIAPERLSDRNYIHAVEFLLDGLVNENRG
jgi:hypothetical protein